MFGAGASSSSSSSATNNDKVVGGMKKKDSDLKLNIPATSSGSFLPGSSLVGHGSQHQHAILHGHVGNHQFNQYQQYQQYQFADSHQSNQPYHQLNSTISRPSPSIFSPSPVSSVSQTFHQPSCNGVGYMTTQHGRPSFSANSSSVSASASASGSATVPACNAPQTGLFSPIPCSARTPLSASSLFNSQSNFSMFLDGDASAPEQQSSALLSPANSYHHHQQHQQQQQFRIVNPAPGFAVNTGSCRSTPVVVNSNRSSPIHMINGGNLTGNVAKNTTFPSISLSGSPCSSSRSASVIHAANHQADSVAANTSHLESFPYDNDCIDSVLLHDLDISDHDDHDDDDDNSDDKYFDAKNDLEASFHSSSAIAIVKEPAVQCRATDSQLMEAESFQLDPLAQGLINADRTSIVMKAVMTTREAGLLIGKGGKTIGEIRDACGGAMIKILGYNGTGSSFYGNAGGSGSMQFGERLLIVSGSIDKVSKAFFLISDCFKSPEIHLLVPHICMGSIIGKGGKRVRDLEGVSNARIAASTEFIDPNSCERCVSVIGSAESIRIAIYHVAFALSKSSAYTHRMKESTLGLLPRTFDSSSSSSHNGNSGAIASSLSSSLSDPATGSEPDSLSDDVPNPKAAVVCGTGSSSTTFSPIRNPSGKVSLIKVVTWIFSQIPEFAAAAQSDHNNKCLPSCVDPSSIFTFVFYLNNKVVGCIIGKNGATIHSIRQKSMCQIKINAMTLVAPSIGIYPSFLVGPHSSNESVESLLSAPPPINLSFPKSFRCRRVIMTGTLHEIVLSLICMREKIIENDQGDSSMCCENWIVPLVQTVTKRNLE